MSMLVISLSFQIDVSSSYELTVTELRVNNHYIMWYKNVATLILTIILPLALLIRWNYNTYAVIQRRQRLKHRPRTYSRANIAKVKKYPFFWEVFFLKPSVPLSYKDFCEPNLILVHEY